MQVPAGEASAAAEAVNKQSHASLLPSPMHDKSLLYRKGPVISAIGIASPSCCLVSQCASLVQVPAGEASAAAEAVNKQSQALAQEYGALEKQLDVSVGQSERRPPDQTLTPDSADQLLTLLLTLPHGVVKYSHTVPGKFAGYQTLSTVLLLLLCGASAT